MKIIIATVAGAECMQAQRQALDLQQSGATGCLDFGGETSAAADGSADTEAACWCWWHGISAEAVFTGVAAFDANSWVICTDAIAVVAPLRTRATLSSTRNRMAQSDMPSTLRSDSPLRV
ncbi:hypothetical protein ABQ078_01445 [Xanthomonas hortorum pv. hederae]